MQWKRSKSSKFSKEEKEKEKEKLFAPISIYPQSFGSAEELI